MSQKLYLIQKPKNCTIKVYVYDNLAQYYPPATTLKTSFNLPTLSQAFEEFFKDNFLFIYRSDSPPYYTIDYEFATPFNLKVSWGIKRNWNTLSKDQKKAVMFWFNRWLRLKIQSIYGGRGV